MLTLEIKEYQDRVKRRMVYAFVAISVITVAVALLLPGRPLASAVLGIAAAGILLATSSYTMNRMIDAAGLSVAWVAVDYLVKVVAVLGSLLLARYVSIFDPVAVAVSVGLAIVVTAGVQVTSVRAKQRMDSEPS